MAQQNKTRLYVLIGLAILSAIFFILVIIPNSPLIPANTCMDTEKAEKMYASSNIKERNTYIEKRNSHCKELFKYAEKPKDTYERLDNCNMVDSVLDASKHYMDLHKDNKAEVRSELKFLNQNIKKYNYCPQYVEVVNYLDTAIKELK